MIATTEHQEQAKKPKRKRAAPEKRIQAAIKKDLWMLGFFVNDLSQPRRTMLPRGLPDLFIAHRKYGMAFVEVKAGKNDLSHDQRQWHYLAKREGVTVITARSTMDVLKALGVPIQ